MIEFCRQLAGALDFARKKGFIYTDLHDEAVMVDKEGSPRLIDLSGFVRVDQTEGALVSNEYGDPHLLRFGGAVGRQSDFHGVTGLIYFILTGDGPGVSLSRAGEHKQAVADVLNKARGRRGMFGRSFKT